MKFIATSATLCNYSTYINEQKISKKKNLIIKKSLFIVVFLVGTLNGKAQEIISSQGDHYTSTGSQISFTIGETVVETGNSSSNQITQGFHQPQLSIQGLSDRKKGLSLFLYPNPTMSFVNIEVKDFGNLQYILMDSKGEVISSNKIDSEISKIDFSGFANGNYFIRITDDKNQPLKTFKITRQK